MGEKIKQHYIPISYLEKFTTAESLYVFDLVETKIFTTKPENVAHVRDFYSVDTNGKSKQNVIEDYFAEVEGKSKPVIGEFVSSMKIPNKRDWAIIAEFIAGMHLRVPDFRQKQLEMSQYFIDLMNYFSFSTKEAYENTCKRYEKDTGEKLNITYEATKTFVEKPELYQIILHQNEYIQMIFQLMPIITHAISNMTPYLLFATGEARFVTSDNPVILMDTNPKRPPYLGYGWYTKTVNVYFPLSPYACLVLAWEGEYHALPANDMSVSILNSNIGFFATRYVFSKEKEISWYKSKEVNRNDKGFLKEFVKEEKDRKSSVVSGPIPQTLRPISLNLLRRSAY